MNGITWTVTQLEQRAQLIENLHNSADPGTFANLDQLTIDQLQELTDIITGEAE